MGEELSYKRSYSQSLTSVQFLMALQTGSQKRVLKEPKLSTLLPALPSPGSGCRFGSCPSALHCTEGMRPALLLKAVGGIQPCRLLCSCS